MPAPRAEGATAVDLVWRPLARADLLDIYAFVARANPAAADRLYDRLREKATLLAAQPRIGPRRPAIRPSVRILVERPYLILYETHPDTDQGAIAWRSSGSCMAVAN